MNKTYYIIRRGGDAIRVRSAVEQYAGTFTGPVDISRATRFSTIPQALEAISRRAKAQTVNTNPLTISRITETPAGPSTIRLVSTRTIDATKPVVIFDGEVAAYVTEGFGERRLGTGGSLKQAKVFSDVNDALTALQQHRLAVAHIRGENLGLKIHQVEVIPGTPTVTETVLS